MTRVTSAPPSHGAVIDDDSALPSRLDETVRRASAAIGGPWGRHAGKSRFSMWTPLRVLLALTCFTLLLGFLQKSPCASGQWSGNKQYTHMCYSDIVPLWSDERLDVGAVPYRDTQVEYPVLTGGFMLITAELTRGVRSIADNWSAVVVFGGVTALLLSACGLIVTYATAQTQRRRPYDAAIFALSPLLVFHAFSNWDLLAMSMASVAILAWSRRKPVLAGVFIGLGTAAKLYPVLLLFAIWILAIRTKRYAGAAWATLAAAVAWLAVNLPIALAYYDGWARFYRFSSDRPAERSTIWAIMRTFWPGKGGSVYNQDSPFWVPPGRAVALLLVAVLIALAWAGLRSPAKPRLGQLAFLAVLAFLLTTKVWSPQYSLWLVPLLALARPRWRLNLVWQFAEIAVWFLTLTLLLGFNVKNHGVSYGTLMIALVIRDVLLLVLAGLILREMWRPELDVVRADGTDDPAGGEFDGAEDFRFGPIFVTRADREPQPEQYVPVQPAAPR
jgi:uncharacterized membrane protein